MKKDLILSRYPLFNDQPESFHVLKDSFANISEDLSVEDLSTRRTEPTREMARARIVQTCSEYTNCERK